MGAMVFETTCGEWDVVTGPDDYGNVKCLQGFISEEKAVEALRQMGWRLDAVVRIQYVATY